MNGPEVIVNLLPRPTEPAINTPPVDGVRPVDPSSQAGWGINIQIQELEASAGGSTAEETRDDQVVDVTSGGESRTEFQIVVTRTGTQSQAYTFTSNKLGVATVSNTGKVTYVSDGKVRIRVTHGPTFADVTFKLSSSQVPEIVEFKYAASGSARNECDSRIDNAIDSLTPAVNGPFFDTQDHVTPAYVRNASCWANGFEGITAISPWNSSGLNKRAGVAVTPRHIVFAKHFQIGTDSTVRFIAANNTIVEKTMISKIGIDGSDIAIGLLDSDLPASIQPVEVLPANYANYFPSGMKHITCMALDQEEKALVVTAGFSGSSVITLNPPLVTERMAFYEQIVGGDSGNPVFLVINNKLVLLSTWWTAGSGPFMPAWRTEIEAAITSLGAFGHSLSDVDLSSFTDFS